MTASIRRLPGHQCRYFARGRCLYEERLNPGYDRSLRCRVLLEWEASYDDFLLRAEAFRLGAATAAGLWENKIERLVEDIARCENFAPGGTEATGCANALDELCVCALPPCPGRCRRFVRDGEDD